MSNFLQSTAWLGGLLLLWLPLARAQGEGILTKTVNLDRLNETLSGKVLDFTHNHGADRRIWSPALNERRDLYVYVPPGFDLCLHYPMILWLHGFTQDEETFVQYVVRLFDDAMVAGTLPPAVIAAPDGSLKGRATLFGPGSFFVNSKAGRFEDYVLEDVWGFVTENFPIRPEREAHAITGISMGGFSAFNLAMKHPDMFKVVSGIYPPLNLRWVDCHGHYMRKFDPCCWGWRTQIDRGWEVLGRFYGGLVTIRVKQVLDPLFGTGPEAVAGVSRENPIEMIDRFGLKPGVLDMYVAYGGRDEFNIDAQVESFLYRARQRGLPVAVAYDPKGRHNMATAIQLAPGLLDWLGPRLPGPTPPSSSTTPPPAARARR